jgi:protein subunit release factor A
VANDQKQFRKLMQEQSDLEKIVTLYRQYKKLKQTIERYLQHKKEE